LTTSPTPDWQRLLRGAFAFETAPFASHPSDERRALEAVALATRCGVSKIEIERKIREYLLSKNYNPDRIPNQIRAFRKFFAAQYAEIKNCWILSQPKNGEQEFVYIFSGRKSLDDILYYCMHIYQCPEFNGATQFMRAKKKRWPTFKVDFHRFEGGGLWEGRASIGSDPTYLLERAYAVLSKRLDPTSAVVWRPLPIPNDPGPTWEGLRIRS
jgi:hypothetical protein